MFKKKQGSRIVMIDPKDLDFFNLSLPKHCDNSHIPLTFVDFHDCLDLIIDEDKKQTATINNGDVLEKVERFNGMTELKLSFFTDAYNWQ